MSYTKTTWRNNQAPAINADNLNHMEQGIESAHNQIDVNTSNIGSLTTQVQNNATNIASEISARQSGDSSLQSQIDQLVAPTGEAPNPAEIENARIGDDGVTYDTLGNAIRTQFSDVKDDFNNSDLIITGMQNLLNNTTWEENYLLTTTGQLSENSSYRTTDKLYVDGGGEYTTICKTVTGYRRIGCFDQNDNFISPLLINETNTGEHTEHFTVPNNASYIRYSESKESSVKGVIKGDNLSKRLDSLSAVSQYLNLNKNVFDKTETSNIHTGQFWRNGTLSANDEFTALLIPCDESTNYICTGTSYRTFYYDENMNLLGGSEDWDGSANYQFTTPSNCKFVGLSIRHSTYPVNSYVVSKGTTLPTYYVPYGSALLSNSVLTENSNNINAVIDNVANEVGYTVRVGATREYTSFTDCIRALAGDNRQKTIYVDAGVYDIYAEIGGDNYANTVTNTAWQDWNDIIPPNTKIVGCGNVVFDFAITSTNPYATDKLSPLNVKWSAEIENITINAINCRYGIHDDGSSDSTANFTKHKYKNVIVNKSGNGYAQAFGSGIGKGTIMEFDGCIFKSPAPFSVHSNVGSYDGLITFRDCAFDCTNSANSSMRFSGMAPYTGDQHIPVNIFNCYMNEKIVIQREDASITTEVNPFKLTVVRSSNVTIDTSRYTAEELRYEPVVYQ